MNSRFAGMYGSLPYALAQGDVEIPYLILQSFLYSVITYWLIRSASYPDSWNCIIYQIFPSIPSHKLAQMVALMKAS